MPIHFKLRSERTGVRRFSPPPFFVYAKKGGRGSWLIAGRLAWFAGLLLLASAMGCNTVRPFPPANFQQPGWTVQQGQAVWKRSRQAPEIAGEILLATNTDGRAFVQFSKNPFPLLVAQSSSRSWQVQIPTQGKRYSGHGKPPRRLIFIYLPRVLAGRAPPKDFSWQQLPDNGWRLENRATGESVEVYFAQ